MHVVLIDGSFVPHNLISAQERALSLYQSSRWPPDLKYHCPLGPRKEPRYIILFSQKILASESPPGSPTEPLWQEITACRAFYISLDISLYLKGPKERASPHVPQKRSPSGNRRPFQSLNITFGVPSKGVLPLGPPHVVPCCSCVGLQ